MSSPHHPSQAHPRTRRTFLAQAGLAFLTPVLSHPFPTLAASNAEPSAIRTAIFGSTGRGNYGHDLDRMFVNRPGIDLVALADPDPAGRAGAASRTGIGRTYADYRILLRETRPRWVSIAPRWTVDHLPMALAALQQGAHLAMEKPIATDLAEADRILELAHRKNRTVAVAHKARLEPAFILLKQRLDNGLIGELRELRAHGKQDSRAGGEDMMVLGTHLFDLMRFFAGDPVACSATIHHAGRPIRRSDARTASEGIGPVAGDQVHARFEFPNGIIGSFTSQRGMRETDGGWGIELRGTRGTARIFMDTPPLVFLAKNNRTANPLPGPNPTLWEPLDPNPRATLAAAGHPLPDFVADSLDALRTGRTPVCSGLNALRALEMVMATYQAALSGQRVVFPLANRRHPLGTDPGANRFTPPAPRPNGNP